MTLEEITIKHITIEQYPSLMELWKAVEGMGLSDADSEEGIRIYLERNQGLSFSAWKNESCVGTVLCGHDGRRGYLYHLAVHPEYRNSGIGRTLLEKAISSLEKIGIGKCHIFVYADNSEGRAFWARSGWEHRRDIELYSKVLRKDV